jgi:hypothetical protein
VLCEELANDIEAAEVVSDLQSGSRDKEHALRRLGNKVPQLCRYRSLPIIRYSGRHLQLV